MRKARQKIVQTTHTPREALLSGNDEGVKDKNLILGPLSISEDKYVFSRASQTRGNSKKNSFKDDFTSAKIWSVLPCGISFGLICIYLPNASFSELSGSNEKTCSSNASWANDVPKSTDCLFHFSSLVISFGVYFWFILSETVHISTF